LERLIPSGKLGYTYPQELINFWHKSWEEEEEYNRTDHKRSDWSRLFEIGIGLSSIRFRSSNLILSKKLITDEDVLKI
jgi:hypothetical protein